MADMLKQIKKEKTARSIAARLGRIRGGMSLAEGEHLLDLCLYRNKSGVRQVVTDMLNQRFTLLPATFTAKTIRNDIKAGAWRPRNDGSGKADYVGSSVQLEKFPGGTIILTRKAAIPLMAKNILEFVCVVDGGKFDPETDSDEE